jgi:type IX secretion system PorP/SprF family membrane protein
MKHKPILIALTVIFIGSTKTLAQDAFFTQWENMPVYLNPALTGNFDGLLRLRAQHRNQWRSLLKASSYKTNAVSAEYKFSGAGTRKISAGALYIHDKAGSLDFRTGSINLTASVVQLLGSPENPHHSIAMGINVGWAGRKIDFVNAQWPGPTPTDLNEKTSYPDVSAGLLWQYTTNTHFAFQLGSALLHLNSPNISFSDTSVSKLNQRFNLHGNIEIPLVRSVSMVPSFLFSSQGPADHEQFSFGLNTRWYPKASSPNFVQLGFFARTNTTYTGNEINTYMLTATVDIHSILLGFSYDRFEDIESSAYEISVGYTFSTHGSRSTPGNPQPGIML